MRATLIAMAVAAAGFSPAAAQAAESYDGCDGFIDAVPAIISSPGVWCLGQDLSTGSTSGVAIEITTNNVVLDCNHFKLGGLAAGPTSVAEGIYANGRNYVTVRNCAVRGFHTGIHLAGDGQGNRVVDNRLDGNLRYGIVAGGSTAQVLRNRVYNTGGDVDAVSTVAIDANSEVRDNIVENVVATHADGWVYGIYVSGTGSLVSGNIVSGLQPQGNGIERGIYVAGSNAVLTDNQLTAVEGSTGIGIRTSAFSGAMCGGNTLGGFATAIDGDCTEISANPSN